MNAAQLNLQISGAINHAVCSGQTTPIEVIAMLELIKHDIATNLRESSKPKIIPPPGQLPPNFRG